jgi:hypothetical protein
MFVVGFARPRQFAPSHSPCAIEQKIRLLPGAAVEKD